MIALQVAVARIRLENEELQREGRRLQTDPTALEEAAHGSLGMIRPGEKLVIVHDDAATPDTQSAPAAH
jgi:cell division protein FtsB